MVVVSLVPDNDTSAASAMAVFPEGGFDYFALVELATIYQPGE